jgi:hypothetical protein
VGLVKKTIFLLALIADTAWLYLPAALFFFGLGSWGSADGALGKGTGFFLAIMTAVALTRLWAPYSFAISRPLLVKIAKRLGFEPPPGKD